MIYIYICVIQKTIALTHISDTYYCDFSNENCVFDQENTYMTNWILFTPNKGKYSNKIFNFKQNR